jgi:hypothetical protein
LVEYGALAELTRAANGSGSMEGVMQNGKCKTGPNNQGKKTC